MDCVTNEEMNDLVGPIRAKLFMMSQEQRKRVAAVVGLPFSTVQKIATGDTPNPRVDTWGKLASYFGVSCEVKND